MKKNVKNNVYWIGYMDWDLQNIREKAHGFNRGMKASVMK